MLAVLRRRNFALLWLGGLVSSVGDLVLYVALPFYVYALSGSALATGGMFLAETLPRLVLSSLAGVVADRWDRRRTMLAADLGRAVAILLLLALHSRDTLWLVYLVGAAESAIGQFFMPARGALLPTLVPDGELVAANGLTGVADAVTQLVGPALGGALYSLLGLGGVVLADSASFLFSALMLALLRPPAAPATPAPAGQPAAAGALSGFLGTWLAGLRLVAGQRLLATVFLALGLGTLGQGILNVMVVIWVREVLHGGAEVFGWMITAQGVGGLLGGLLVAPLGRRLPPPALLCAGGVTAGALLLVIVAFPSLPLALALIVPIGVTIVGYTVSASTLLQRGAEDAYRGRVFGALGTTNALLMLAGIAVAGALGDRLGPSLLFGVAGALYLLAGLAALNLFRAPAARAAMTAADGPAPAG